MPSSTRGPRAAPVQAEVVGRKGPALQVICQVSRTARCGVSAGLTSPIPDEQPEPLGALGAHRAFQ